MIGREQKTKRRRGGGGGGGGGGGCSERGRKTSLSGGDI